MSLAASGSLLRSSRSRSGTTVGMRAQSASLFVANPAQPPNVGDAIIAAAAYKESGAYDRDVTSVAHRQPTGSASVTPPSHGPHLSSTSTGRSSRGTISGVQSVGPAISPLPMVPRLGRLGPTRPRSGDRADPAPKIGHQPEHARYLKSAQKQIQLLAVSIRRGQRRGLER